MQVLCRAIAPAARASKRFVQVAAALRTRAGDRGVEVAVALRAGGSLEAAPLVTDVSLACFPQCLYRDDLLCKCLIRTYLPFRHVMKNKK